VGNSIVDNLAQPSFSGIGAANSDFRQQEIAQMNAQAQSGADEAYYNTVETQRFERQAASAQDNNPVQADEIFTALLGMGNDARNAANDNYDWQANSFAGEVGPSPRSRLTLSNGSPDGVDGPYINTALDGPDANGRARDRLRDEIARIDSRREQRLSVYEANSNAAYSATVQAEDAALATAINVSANGSDPSTLHPYVGLTDDGTKLYGATAENRVEVVGHRSAASTISDVADSSNPAAFSDPMGSGYVGNTGNSDKIADWHAQQQDWFVQRGAAAPDGSWTRTAYGVGAVAHGMLVPDSTNALVAQGMMLPLGPAINGLGSAAVGGITKAFPVLAAPVRMPWGRSRGLSSIDPLMSESAGSWSQKLQFWTEPKVLGGDKVGYRRVYQRDNLFDPYARNNGMSNLDLMRKGRPPIGYDNQPVNLHHLTQNEPGSLAELGGKFHSDYTSILHGMSEPRASFRYTTDGLTSESEKAFNRYKYWYWRNRAESF
jgi:A nuclease of the HNH/ENDO VII superfamily with conserved LHH